MNELLAEISIISTWEAIALLLSLAYVILAAKGNLWCWPAAFSASAIYSIVFYDVNLLMDSLLQVYYMAMAIYGWFSWQLGFSKKKHQVKYTSWPVHIHLALIVILSILSVFLAQWVEQNTSADFALADTFTTIFSIYATYLVAERIVENWLYWIVIDAVSIYLYIQKSLLITAILFVCYTLLAVWGYIQWRKQYLEQQATN